MRNKTYIKELVALDRLKREIEESDVTIAISNSEKNVFVYDLPNDTANRSNLAMIYMHSDVSYNYKFNLSNFFPCDSSKAEWSLDIIDSTQDALAVITFADCYGNDTTIVIEHYHRITSASDSVLNNQNIVLGNDYWKQFSIKNNSVNTFIVYELTGKFNKAFFGIRVNIIVCFFVNPNKLLIATYHSRFFCSFPVFLYNKSKIGKVLASKKTHEFPSPVIISNN